MIRGIIIAAAVLAACVAAQARPRAYGIGQRDQVTKGLVAYWAMRNSGTTVYDEWGGYEGGASNGVTFGTQYAAVGYGAYFDGTNGTIRLTDNAAWSFGNGSTDSPFTFSLWVNLSSFTNQTLIDKYGGAGAREYSFYSDGFGVLVLIFRDDSAANSLFRANNATMSAYAGRWTHIVATYSGVGGANAANGITFYANGNVLASTAVNNASYVAMENLGNPLYIGSRSGATLFTRGNVDEVRIYNRALTSDEIKQLYRMGKVIYENR